MPVFRVMVIMDNEAFDERRKGTSELSRVLRQVADRCEADSKPPALRLQDCNGIHCGETRFSSE